MTHHYFGQFLAYTMAMVGFLSLCLIIYKKFCMNLNMGINNENLSIENAIRISPRKQILIIKAGNERFLVASDADRTTLLSKLENNKKNKANIENIESINSAKESVISDSVEKELYKEELLEDTQYTPLMKRITEKMKKKA